MEYVHYLNKLVITKPDGQLATTACKLLFDFRFYMATLFCACALQAMDALA